MTAIILAAGDDRRMRPLTDQTHKAVLPVGHSTILGRILDALLAASIRDIVIVTGYRADDVRQYCASTYPDLPVRFVQQDNYDVTGDAGSVALALTVVPDMDEALVFGCDALIDGGVLPSILSSPPDAVAVSRRRIGLEDWPTVGDHVPIGIYRLRRSFCERVIVPHSHGVSLPPLGLSGIITGAESTVAVVMVGADRWAPVCSPNQVESARFHFEPSSRDGILGRTQGARWNLGITDFELPRNAHFPTPAMVEAMRDALPVLMRYGGSSQQTLNQKLAWHLQCDPERLQVLHGSSQVQPIFKRIVGTRPVLMPSPLPREYARQYPSAQTFDDNGAINLDALHPRVPENGVVIFVSPNLPTGSVVGTEAMLRFAEQHPHTSFIIDESFVDFSDEVPVVSRLNDEFHPNIVVIKSLSASFGMPGLRLGYIYCQNPELIRVLYDEIPARNISAQAEHVLELMPAFQDEFAASLARTKEDRTRFAADLEALDGVGMVHPSGGNFLMVTLKGDDLGLGALARAQLLDRFSIAVRDVSDAVAPRAPRLCVAVRLPDENERFCESLAAVL